MSERMGEMSRISIVKKDDGYWLEIQGERSALIKLDVHGALTHLAIVEAYQSSTTIHAESDALRAKLEIAVEALMAIRNMPVDTANELEARLWMQNGADEALRKLEATK